MDRSTVDTYEANAARWLAQRPVRPIELEHARAFAARVPEGALRVDLGCGPGRHASVLGEPAVGLDAAQSMLRLYREHRIENPVVQADVAALPFKRAAVGGAWASCCYQHLPSMHVPIALADLHHSLAVGAPIAATVHAGQGEGRRADDDFPGRYFAHWTIERLTDVLVGAGFTTIAVTDAGFLHATAVRARSLADTVGPDMKLLICGLNPSEYAADAGVGYARRSNRFWTAAIAAGIAAVAFDARAALRHHGTGMTDLVKRATPRAAAITRQEYVDGCHRVQRLVEWLQPRVVCFVGLEGYRAAVDSTAAPGVQPRPFAGRPCYVMPSTSGLNASSTPADFVAHLRAARMLG